VSPIPLLTSPVLVSGDGAIPAAMAARLRRDGRAARLLAPAELTPARIRRAETLILADPADAAAAVAWVLGLCGARPPGRAPLRLVLAYRGDCHPGLPVGAPPGAQVRLEGFALETQAARALLAAHPPHAGFDPLFGQVLHLLIAGSAPPALALLGNAMRLAHQGDGVPVFTLAVDQPDAWRSVVLAAYPEAERCCALRFTPLAAPSLVGVPPVTGGWVFLDSPEAGLDRALSLSAQIQAGQGVAPTICLEVGDAKPSGGAENWDGQILPVSWLDAACRAGTLLDGSRDLLAQVIHEHYRDTTEAQGRDPALEPAGRPWVLLDESYRDASRYQADHLAAKLAATDCRTLPLEEAPAFAFAPLEVERLAEIEHRRWAADRYLNGWTYAPVRDNVRRHHPQLIAYADLSEAMKDLDRYVVRLVPTLLARSGQALVRGLVVGIPASAPTVPAGRRTRHLAVGCLRRLKERYPERGLVLATTLGDPLARLVAACALERFDAALWLLCPSPLPEVIRAQPNPAARKDLLRLAARAERRIALDGNAGLAGWLGRRAQVLILPGTAPAPAAPAKQVRLDPDGDGLVWGFEY
jgi:hypothetical protein